MLRFTAKRNALKALTSASPRVVQNRPFITQLSNKLRSNVELGKAKQRMEKEPTVANIFSYIRLLATERPQEAASAIEGGWQSGKIPVDESFVKEYFKSVAAMGKLDSINMGNLLATVNKAGVKQGMEYTAADMSALMASSRAAAMAPAGGSGFGGNGSRDNPIYVTAVPDQKKAVTRILSNMASIFLMICLVGAIMDDGKSSSTNGDASSGSSPLSGMAGRLGLPGGSIVKQAEKSDKTFNDVVGIDEAKYDLQEIVMYLKDPRRFTRLGGKLPKGVLLTGPPGTGKTLLARAIAGEAGVPFFHTSGSEFEEMYVGVGAKRVRELFETAKKNSPCIIFIDEIDAIGGSRQVKDASAMKMTLNQLLVEMDGFQQNNGIIVIAATNFPESLDSALIRPGRLDKHVDVPMPDIGGRRAILELYGSKVPLDSDVSMEQLARGTPGFSGAELFNLVNQAALKASVDGLKSVGMGALEYAKDKIMMGAERKSAVISQETMRTTAFHEAGHALMALKTAGANPIHKATIMPRGRALGMVMQLPEGDQTSQSRQQMLAFLDVCMGGRVAEEMVFGPSNVTSGASNDIQQATRMARAMVTKYGFSEKVGIMFIDDKGKQSGETQKAVDDEVRDLLNASYARAKHVLETHRKELNMIAAGLMEYESLSGHEIVELTQGKALNLVKRNQAPSRAIKEITTTTSSMAAEKQHLHKGGEDKPPAGGSGGKPVEVKAPAAAAGKHAPAKTGFLDGLFGKKPDAEVPPAAAVPPTAAAARTAAPAPVAAPAKSAAPVATPAPVKAAVPVTVPAAPVVAQKAPVATAPATPAAAAVSAAKTLPVAAAAPKSSPVLPTTTEAAPAAPSVSKPKQ